MEHWRSYIQGRVLEAFGRPQAAVDCYSAALRAEPEFSRAANRAAYLLAQLDRFEEAEGWFRRVLAQDPGNAVAHFNLAYTLDKRGLHEQAVAEFSEATRLRPGLDRAWYGMGLAQARLGRHGEAAGALRQAADLQPMNPHAWYALGMAYHACREPDRVTEVVMHLHRFDPRMTRRLIQDAERADLAHLVKDLVV